MNNPGEPTKCFSGKTTESPSQAIDRRSLCQQFGPFNEQKKRMKPCRECSAPIGNQEDYCDRCLSTVASTAQKPNKQPQAIANPHPSDDESIGMKVFLFCGGLALRATVIVPVTVLATWVVFGNKIPMYQSTLVGLAITGVYAAFDIIGHWLNQIESSN